MSEWQKIFILLLFLFSQVQPINAQKTSFQYLTVKNGLPQNTVQSIVKDKYGFMWFGTWNGLCRYDGYNFKVYNTIPGDSASIANNRIHYIYKDHEGTLWISTFNALICRYNYQTDNFTRFRPEQLPQAIRDSANRLRNLTAFESYAGDLRRQIGEFDLSQTKQHIVFRTKQGKGGGLSDNNVYCVYKDEHGNLWLGTETGGVNKVDLNAKPFYDFSISADDNTSAKSPVRAIYADSVGIWLGTHNNGLFYIDQRTKAQKHVTTGPLSKSIRSIFKDSYGDIWIGYRTGLDKYDLRANKFINYFNGDTSREQNSYRFTSMTEDPVDRSLWFGTFNKVWRYNRKTASFEQQELKKYFNNSSAVCLFFDARKNLWIGTEYSGIIHIRRNSRTGVWIDTIAYHAQGANPKLPDERVNTIAEDVKGNIWAGTSNGLCRINAQTGSVRVYTKKDGLSDQYITKVLADGQGNIWISHKKGVSKLDVKSNVIRNYGVDESDQGSEFMDGSGYIDRSTGEIYFGRTNDFIFFHPSKIVSNPFLPSVVFTELQVLNRPVGVNDTINGRVVLSQPINLTKRITLHHEDRSFSIEFAALHYAEPGKNQYAYMLEGQDKDWVYTDAGRRIASYSNLSAGKYVFKVKASNSDGVWNPTPATLEITVFPPWWRTWWAYLGYVFLLLFAAYVIYKIIRTRQEYNRRLLIERLKVEKAQEIDQLKSRFFTNVSHEFRTPLTLIIDPLESLLSEKLQAENAKDYYRIMHRNARRLLSLINQFLDFRKLETGNMSLRVRRQNIIVFVRNIVSAFAFQAQRRKVQLSFDTEIGELEFGFDADIVDKILYNLLSNAFKFTPQGGGIIVSLNIATGNPQLITLSVSDNGVGIPAELTDKIFEPFYQVDNLEYGKAGGTGVGLSLTRELVTLHKGTIQVSSEPHVKTCFTVTLTDLGGEGAEPGKNDAIQNVEDAVSPRNLVPQIQEQETSAESTMVLVVEDNADVRNYLKMNLSGDYQVIEAENGVEGWEKAIETIPDLIVSDVMMPEMDGFELCRKLKTDEKTSHIPVILLTARQSDQYQIEGYETGADAYIGKPFSSILLRARIKNLIETRKQLRQLFSKSTGFDTKVVGTNAADKAFLSKAAKLIEENMSEPTFGVDWLAGQLFLSRTQLYRKIKALTDQTVHDFITAIRLNKAAELLLEGRLSIAEIAFTIGYSDAKSFSRSFQNQFGQTPKKYRQQGLENT